MAMEWESTHEEETKASEKCFSKPGVLNLRIIIIPQFCWRVETLKPYNFLF
jgi:hypothetical protein